jgi:hypothetical protein
MFPSEADRRVAGRRITRRGPSPVTEDLADALGMPLYERARIEPGNEAGRARTWLQSSTETDPPSPPAVPD